MKIPDVVWESFEIRPLPLLRVGAREQRGRGGFRVKA